MATAAITAGSAALAPILSALGSQNKSGSRPGRPAMEPVLPVLAAAENKKLKRLKNEADKERIYNIISQPEVLGILITLGGIFASNRISFASDRERNAALQSIATTASVLLGLGYAGVGDLTTLIIALGAGGTSLIGSLIDIPDIDLPSIPGGAGNTLLNALFPGAGILNLIP